MDHTRHSGLFSVSDLPVTLIGAGGIGATTALTLAKMGIRDFHIFDSDTVAQENIATQLHRPSDIGMPKVEGLRLTLRQFSDEIEYLDTNYTRVDGASEEIANSIVISAVDSITVRQNIWEALTGHQYTGFHWYLDARMAAEEFQLHIVNENDLGWYDELITKEREEDVPDEVCTMKATFFTSMQSASWIGFVVRAIATGMPLPHKLVVNMQTMTLLKI